MDERVLWTVVLSFSYRLILGLGKVALFGICGVVVVGTMLGCIGDT